MKPIWTLTVVLAPAAKVTLRVRTPLAAVKPSPDNLGNIVVRLFLTARDPVRSVPLTVVAYGEVTRNATVCDAVPVLVICRLSTATSFWVMNFVWLIRSEPLVCTLFQWLGACQRCAVCSVQVPDPAVTVKAAWLLMLSQYATWPPNPRTEGVWVFMKTARP